MKICKLICLFSLFLVVFVSCKHENRLKIDLSNVSSPELVLYRYDKDLFNINHDQAQAEISQLQKQYSVFLGNAEIDSIQIKQLIQYLNDPTIKIIHNDVQKQYPDNNYLLLELKNLFHHYKYYFPDHGLPRLYFYISGLDYEAPLKVLGDTVLIVALDMYLGKNYSLYEKVGIPAYKKQNFSKEYLMVEVSKALAVKHQGNTNNQSTMLDYMIESGKVLYFIDAMLPDVHDSVKMAYNTNQYKWMSDYEDNVWSYIIDEKLLYEKDMSLINKMIGEAPFTSFFGNNSAPRCGVWIGWQIVRGFMNQTPEITLHQMISGNYSNQEIFNKSRYKPRR